MEVGVRLQKVMESQGTNHDTNSFQEEDVLWVQRMSNTLGISDGVTDDPTGSS